MKTYPIQCQTCGAVLNDSHAAAVHFRTHPQRRADPLQVGTHYSVRPNEPRCIFVGHRGERCQRNAHSFGAHVV